MIQMPQILFAMHGTLDLKHLKMNSYGHLETFLRIGETFIRF